MKQPCTVPECSRPQYGRGFCNLHYQRWRKHGDTDLVLTDFSSDPLERLARRSATEGECHVWTGWRNGDGYGRVNWRGRGVFAHRLMYEAHLGPIPEGLIVRHGCDNPPCIRLDHLSLGTDKDNSHDRDVRGRQVANRGASNGHAVLVEDDIRAIRAAHQAGASQQSLAALFGVSRPNIGYIVRRITWRHIE